MYWESFSLRRGWQRLTDGSLTSCQVWMMKKEMVKQSKQPKALLALWSFMGIICTAGVQLGFDQSDSSCETIHQGQFWQISTDFAFSLIISVFSASTGLTWPASYDFIPAAGICFFLFFFFLFHTRRQYIEQQESRTDKTAGLRPELIKAHM